MKEITISLLLQHQQDAPIPLVTMMMDLTHESLLIGCDDRGTSDRGTYSEIETEMFLP